MKTLVEKSVLGQAWVLPDCIGFGTNTNFGDDLVKKILITRGITDDKDIEKIRLAFIEKYEWRCDPRKDGLMCISVSKPLIAYMKNPSKPVKETSVRKNPYTIIGVKYQYDAIQELAPEGIEVSDSKKDLIKYIFCAFSNAMSNSVMVAHRIIQIPIELCRENAKLPTYATDGSAAMDIYSPEEYIVAPGESIMIPTGIKVNIFPSVKAPVPSSSLNNAIITIASVYPTPIPKASINESKTLFLLA